MPTISAARRRGYTPEAIREFCEKIGVAKRDNLIDLSLLEFCVREHLNKISLRRMVVMDPIKVVITNVSGSEIMTSENNPEDHSSGEREMQFSSEIYLSARDFMEIPPKKFFRLSPGGMVRLKSAVHHQVRGSDQDADGSIKELRCTYGPNSRSGSDTSGVAVKGVIHWGGCEERSACRDPSV